MIYIILFKDHAMQSSLQYPDINDYQGGARFFECVEDVPLSDVSLAYYYSWDTSIEQFPSTIKEIKTN